MKKQKCPLCGKNVEELQKDKHDVCINCAYEIWKRFSSLLIKRTNVFVSTDAVGTATVFSTIK